MWNRLEQGGSTHKTTHKKYKDATGKKVAPPYRVWFRQNYHRRFGRELPAREEACPSGIRVSSSRYLRLA